VIASIAMGRSALLEKDGKKSEAEAVKLDAIKKLGEGNTYARSMVSQMKLAKLPGSVAPELTVDHHYGEYSSLASMRGKVVVLDFTADWCIFCKKAYPDMKKMYAELHPKGLEVIGLTTYYGYYKDQKNLTPEAEFAANKGHIEEFGLPWPLLFGPRENQTNYGVSGIPHYVVIGRDGKVASITVGFNEPLHKQLRASVEKALEANNNK
ncbi:MAG: TlpA disulfide reductase family protein, partial [Chthonomonadales bacterium]